MMNTVSDCRIGRQKDSARSADSGPTSNPLNMRTLSLLASLGLSALAGANVARAQDTTKFTHADTLRGSITPQRAWWDVTFYDLHVAVNPADSSVRGYVGITYRVLKPAQEMQIDLKQPLAVDSMVQSGRQLTYRRDGDAFFVTLADQQRAGDRNTVVVYYHGQPRAAQHAPWDGGFVWTHDSLGVPWVASAVQGFGASAWWPNKDTQADEPDSQRVAITIPKGLVDVSNGRLRSTTPNADGTTTYEWFVTNPINNYDVAVNAGQYTHFSDVFDGEDGRLTLDYWPLSYHLAPAKRQFEQVKPMLSCFEHWFGPYPWYADGYKLVETPHLGMEHQSAVAYGNHYANGYLGSDLSGTGWGLKWDFIIVHESAHEWFGNNITSKDVADMWVHESFANYAEALYTECQFGKAAGAAYVIGTRKRVRNDMPVVGRFGVNNEGSGDMYYKGGNMLHTIRQIVNDDVKFRKILRGLNTTFRHATVTGEQVRRYISDQAGVDLSTVFEQYLNTTRIPVFEYKVTGSDVAYRWTDVVPGFTMPVRVSIGGVVVTLHPTEAWQTAKAPGGATPAVTVDENFYVLTRTVQVNP
jgi:aminopeptidase N